MRGKEVRLFFLFGLLRITPAYAGKRKSCAAQKTSAWDHPRMCGEKRHTFVSIESGVGSPPHVRGKGPLHLLRCRVKGITPACAGKSVWSRLNRVRLADHPRMCGEKESFPARVHHHMGSPPHVRGKEPGTRQRKPRPGITPACAGKSRPALRCTPRAGDHPRMCGEKTKKIP